MITDGGPHPAEFWAQITAEHIAPIDKDMTGQRRQAALKLQMAIADALQPHHAKVQDNERSKCSADPAHHTHPVDPVKHGAHAHADEALKAVEAAAKGTEWEKHLTFGHGKPAWLDAYEAEVAKLGADNVPALTDEQTVQLHSWQRQNIIHGELKRHFATAQHIERSWHGDRLAGRA